MNPSTWDLFTGDSGASEYTVAVQRTGFVDSDWAASGSIAILNPAPVDATITGVTDVLTGGINATVNCSVTFPFTLGAGSTLNCTFSASLPDASARINTATATLQNHSFDPQGVATNSGTADFSGTASVDFAGASVTQVDECICVSDSLLESLGTVCAVVDTLPKTFAYTLVAGPFSECGDRTIVNIARFVTNDTVTTGSDDHRIIVHVPCAGCTLTPGYWKTHSLEDPAPYDDTWALLGSLQEDTVFFLSGQSYYQVLWTSPGGNAYYILAHAYIATRLNELNGAFVPINVQSAFNQATTLFNAYTPSQIGALRGNDPTRQRFVQLASLLDSYNNGLQGVPHCSEAA